ncbi:Pyruvate/ketoisovalerate oxidoreductase [Thermodesulfobium narugense DSM 14796]|uniref:Pyruvate/ketoisovalerate oxidoreductase n=1 Tax=Thermodesulfobium narugense DSM 14796 TaxID=747365 RepID=M1E4C4_9BACT|nr:2-oxoacid:acceptor oxidoreductase family protein [Thermodesulfobium narugense]AEE13992.1 Pyruvate/ketoisovalerate oxidoreductase [Thermodesulfobium narugense DSM 14796]
MTEELIIAGFGGQGVMTMGQVLAYAGLNFGKEVSYLPSYGPEQRGGTANCMVVISDEAVSSPYIDEPTSLIIMNQPSLDRFAPTLRDNGILMYNASLIKEKVVSDKASKVVGIEINHLANQLGKPQLANMIMLGAYLGVSNIMPVDSIKEVLPKVFSSKYHHLLPLNYQALDLGLKTVKG